MSIRTVPNTPQTRRPTPANLIMGFLGAGKTTAILGLLSQKPPEQVWAVLVNEFGQIGIDGAIYEAHNAVVRELPGGCLCCALGLPFQVTVNRILAEIKPDRLIIEPTGLGHPQKILDRLTGGYFKQALDVRASICLVDPRKLKDPRYTGNANFLDQIALSDVLVANKMDLADPESVSLFDHWLKNSKPMKTASSHTIHGRLPVHWLDLPRLSIRSAEFPEAHGMVSEHQDEGFDLKMHGSAPPCPSKGEIFPEGARFDYRRLYDVLARHRPARAKAVVDTDQGWFIFNSADGLIDCVHIRPGKNSRIEILDEHSDLIALWDEIDQCLLQRSPSGHRSGE